MRKGTRALSAKADERKSRRADLVEPSHALGLEKSVYAHRSANEGLRGDMAEASFAGKPDILAGSAITPRRVFWATWAGWMLDGFDSTIYIYVLVPALTELLSAEGIAPGRAAIGLYGGFLFTVFMLGWACSMFWGWLADRIGRVSVMCMTVLVYSIATASCGLAGGLLSFAVFRFVSGFGIGGEWAAGTPLLQESVPETMRVRLAGWLHTATPTGILLASIAASCSVHCPHCLRSFCACGCLSRPPGGAAGRPGGGRRRVLCCSAGPRKPLGLLP
jgi:MFS family permease